MEVNQEIFAAQCLMAMSQTSVGQQQQQQQKQSEQQLLRATPPSNKIKDDHTPLDLSVKGRSQAVNNNMKVLFWFNCTMCKSWNADSRITAFVGNIS